MLRQKGLTVIAHSESDRGGEIDLIAVNRKTKTMIFVEVKTLASTKPGHPADRVDENKQAKVTRAALRYLHRKKMLGIRSRFDVVAVLPGRLPKHFRDAWRPEHDVLRGWS